MTMRARASRPAEPEVPSVKHLRTKLATYAVLAGFLLMFWLWFVPLIYNLTQAP